MIWFPSDRAREYYYQFINGIYYEGKRTGKLVISCYLLYLSGANRSGYFIW